MRGFKISFILILLIGMNTYAQRKKDFKSIQLVVDNVNDRYPGKGVGIGVEVILNNGKKKKTRGFLRGKLNWKKFNVEVNGGRFENGRIILFGQSGEDVHDIEVEVSSIDFPQIGTSKKTIQLNYKGQINAYYNGERGANGADGDNKGTSLIFRDGNDGGDGEPGGVGGNGASVDVYVRLKYDTILKTELLDILVESSHRKDEMFLVNPNGGYFKIYANGGVGGKGGNGGEGGNGKDARGASSNKKAKSAGRGGDGGNGAIGGDGGNGGEIRVFIKEDAAQFKDLIQFENNGGEGGQPGLGGLAGSGGDAGGNFPQGINGQNGVKGSIRSESGQAGPTPTIEIINFSKDW